MSNIFLNKLMQRQKPQSSQQINQDIKQFIYVQSKWPPLIYDDNAALLPGSPYDEQHGVDFQFCLTTNNKCYKGKLNFVQIKTIAAELDVNYQEFYNECKQALTATIALPGFDYDLDAEQMIFKLYKCQGYETLYLDLILHEVDNNFDILDAAIDQLASNQSLTHLCNGNDTEHEQQTIQEFKNYVEESKRLEQKMLKKFILLLNSKKDKINELEVQIKHLCKNRKIRNEIEHEVMQNVVDNEDEDARIRVENAAEKEINENDIYEMATELLTQLPSLERIQERRRLRIVDDTMVE